ncbi:hypothetical protein B0H16DRAFT_1834823, partial [Mycena metata]
LRFFFHRRCRAPLLSPLPPFRLRLPCPHRLPFPPGATAFSARRHARPILSTRRCHSISTRLPFQTTLTPLPFCPSAPRRPFYPPLRPFCPKQHRASASLAQAALTLTPLSSSLCPVPTTASASASRATLETLATLVLCRPCTPPFTSKFQTSPKYCMHNRTLKLRIGLSGAYFHFPTISALPSTATSSPPSHLQPHVCSCTRVHDAAGRKDDIDFPQRYPCRPRPRTATAAEQGRWRIIRHVPRARLCMYACRRGHCNTHTLYILPLQSSFLPYAPPSSPLSLHHRHGQ